GLIPSGRSKTLVGASKPEPSDFCRTDINERPSWVTKKSSLESGCHCGHQPPPCEICRKLVSAGKSSTQISPGPYSAVRYARRFPSGENSGSDITSSVPGSGRNNGCSPERET